MILASMDGINDGLEPYDYQSYPHAFDGSIFESRKVIATGTSLGFARLPVLAL